MNVVVWVVNNTWPAIPLPLLASVALRVGGGESYLDYFDVPDDQSAFTFPQRITVAAGDNNTQFQIVYQGRRSDGSSLLVGDFYAVRVGVEGNGPVAERFGPFSIAVPSAIHVATVAINPDSVTNIGDVMDVHVSLTGLATTDTILYPIVYQALDSGGYSPIDPSGFLFPQIRVPAGSTTIDFQMQYQSLSSPGNYVVSIVTAHDASQVADLTQLPVTNFASFIIQRPSVSPPSEGQDITVGGQPIALAFDGTNIWVATQADNSVWILSANDGSVLGRFSITGTPQAMVSVANVIWIASETATGGYLTEANSSGIIRIFALPTNAYGLISVQYDDMPAPVLFFVNGPGDALWRFDPATGQANGAYWRPAGTRGQWWDLLFDGLTIWISNAGNNTVVQVDPTGSQVLQTVPVGDVPTAMAFGGGTLWVANSRDHLISRVSVGEPWPFSFLPPCSIGDNPSSIAFDGANLWVTHTGSNTMTQMRASDGMVLGTLRTGPSPAAIIFDGTHIWVANYGSNTVSKF